MTANNRPSPLDDSILHLLHRAGQKAEGLFIVECPTDQLTPRQYAVLVAVESNPEISQKGLVEGTGIDRSTLANVVGRLVRRGFLSRKRSRGDARTYAVRLSPEGLKALRLVQRAALRADERVLAALEPVQRGALMQALQKIVQNIDPAKAVQS